MWWNERFTSWMCSRQICSNCVMLSWQYGPKSLSNVSNTSLNLCHEELRQFWRQKGVQPGTSKVYLIKWPVSVCVCIFIYIKVILCCKSHVVVEWVVKGLVYQKRCWITSLYLFSLRKKNDSCSFGKLQLNPWCHMDCFTDFFCYISWRGNISCATVYEGSESSWIASKIS